MVVEVQVPKYITKRGGSTVQFDDLKIEHAIRLCFEGLGIKPSTPISALRRRVVNRLCIVYTETLNTPTVEEVQDTVEFVLQSAGEFEAAKAYILYRAEHAKKRVEEEVPDHIRAKYNEDAVYFPTPLQQFQFMDKYSRWNYALDGGRQETWVETVDRAVDYLHELVQTNTGADLGEDLYQRIRTSILRMEVMPSMRLLSMAGAPARRDNTAIYNCSYFPVDSLESFCEAMIISMAGCGVGFSVESKYTRLLPTIAYQDSKTVLHCSVEDSAEGWVDALRLGLQCWFDGKDVQFDFRFIRLAGEPLRTKGGRASGPEPLQRLLSFIRTKILSKQGRQLSTIDAHDIMCAIGGAVVSGGVRRTAMISLFDEDDTNMRMAKSGDFDVLNNQRWNANNSAVYNNTAIDQYTLLQSFNEMLVSGRGEPGIFNRQVALCTIPIRRSSAHVLGTNPCGEIYLRSRQFCNLSAVVARNRDTLEALRDKAEVATIIGTMQSLATYFPQLSPIWKANCEEERLLGVDITGQRDAESSLNKFEVFEYLKNTVVETNRLLAKKLGINQSTATTCVKPSGNTSTLVDCSSGLHARWAPYYIRNVRLYASSPLAKVMQDAGVPMAPENGDDPVNPRTWVISFPIKAPEGSVTRDELSAVDQCNWWFTNKVHWTEHNPSVTITYKPNEVIDLLKWLHEHWNNIGGMAFLPSSNANYAQLPYIEITREEYEQRVKDFPQIDFARIYLYQRQDTTTASQLPACDADKCEYPE